MSVFVVSTERPRDWGDLAGVGATAVFPPVTDSEQFQRAFGATFVRMALLGDREIMQVDVKRG